MRILIYAESWPLLYCLEYFSLQYSEDIIVHQYYDQLSLIEAAGRYPEAIILLDISPRNYILLLYILRSISFERRIIAVCRRVLASDAVVCTFIKNMECINYTQIPFRLLHKMPGRVEYKRGATSKKPIIMMAMNQRTHQYRKINEKIHITIYDKLKSKKTLKVIDHLVNGYSITETAKLVGISVKMVYNHRHKAAMALCCDKNYWLLGESFNIHEKNQKDHELKLWIRENCKYNPFSDNCCSNCRFSFICYHTDGKFNDQENIH
ncbi:helix-turn-helix domain-containing protein [Enterobacter oligotrophicus]|uniref:helix-turn-helix domain-containing protein n=1 Tax=Enterobacter oligotrophicus TaxID=2478464 RepID=UPI00126070A0|nr:helix-turn-helix domain-containing protein [Enterobacter oligotrophicus]